MAGLAIAIFGLSAVATAQTLRKGDAAPALSVEEFIRGEPVTGFEKGHVYVVEFWATWCAPCIANIPHLSRLQEEHEDEGLIVIGVAAAEHGGRDKLVEWVKTSSHAERMNYRVAYDDRNSATMWKDWMRAAGTNRIPHAFIVDHEGKIAFSGHPRHMDDTLKQVLAKRGALAETKKLEVGDDAPRLAIGKFVQGKPVERFEKGKVYVIDFWATWREQCIKSMPHLTELHKRYRDDGVTVIGVNIWEDPAKVKPFMEGKLEEGYKGSDLMGYTVAIEEKLPETTRQGQSGRMASTWMVGRETIPSTFIVDREGKIAWIGHPGEIDGALQRVVHGESVETFMSLLQSQDFERAYELGRRLVEGSARNDSLALNNIAWWIVNPDATPKEQDLDLALAAAKRADELTNHGNDAVLDTLAKVYFDMGKLDKALETQREAVRVSTPQYRQELTARLEWYQDVKKKRGG
jgi:thiol-disulfide isomerase/thioredoxin